MTMKRSWALAALALLGFGTACNEDEQILAMYGTPNVDYRVQGRVTDLEGNPIEGIEVRGKDGLKSVLSGADGSFDLRDNGQKDNLTLNFTDIDGPQTARTRHGSTGWASPTRSSCRVTLHRRMPGSLSRSTSTSR